MTFDHGEAFDVTIPFKVGRRTRDVAEENSHPRSQPLFNDGSLLLRLQFLFDAFFFHTTHSRPLRSEKGQL